MDTLFGWYSNARGEPEERTLSAISNDKNKTIIFDMGTVFEFDDLEILIFWIDVKTMLPWFRLC